MAKDELSKAELYRRERKDRLKKESKKNEKRNAAVAKAKGVALKVVAIVLAVAVVFGATVIIVNSTGSTVFRSKVASVGDYNISSVEFQYYYRTLYNQYYQYASQGYNMGFDATKSPDEQKYTADDTTAPAETTTAADGAKAETTKETTTTNYDTWNDFFADTTIRQIKNLVILSAEAEKANISLSEAEEKEISNQIEQMRTSAADNGYSLNAYLKLVYGSGVTSKFMEKLMKRDALAQKFTQFKQKELANSYSSEEIQKKYNEDKENKYNFVDYRTVTFTVDDDNTEASAKAKAAEFVSNVSDAFTFESEADEILIADAIKSAKESAASAAASGTTADPVDEEAIRKEYKDDRNSSLKEKADYSTVSQSGEEVAKWLFDSSRKEGDINTIAVKTGDKVSSFVVVYMVKPAYRDESVGMNVRHILFKFETTDENSEPTAEQKAAAKAKADDALNQFKAGDKTEASFGELATKLTEDTGSASTGGLYENVVKGQMVEPFENWCFDNSRKPGDTGIVESTYGYHVMYFVSKSDRQVWDNTIRTELASSDYETLVETLSNSAEYETKEHKGSMKSAKRDAVKYVKQYLYNVSRNAESQGQY